MSIKLFYNYKTSGSGKGLMRKKIKYGFTAQKDSIFLKEGIFSNNSKIKLLFTYKPAVRSVHINYIF
jgi:hypothetical protein